MPCTQTMYEHSEDDYEEDEITTLIPDAEKTLSRVGNNDWYAHVVDSILQSWSLFTFISYYFVCIDSPYSMQT